MRGRIASVAAVLVWLGGVNLSLSASDPVKAEPATPETTESSKSQKTAKAKPKQAAEEKAEGYLEWRRGDLLIVDAQRVRPAPGCRFKGKDEATSLASIPLGYEIKAKGLRQADGLLA